MIRFLTAVGSVLLVAACTGEPGQKDKVAAADKIFIDGAVYTVDAERSWAEAVAIAGNEIVFVGSTKDAQAI